MRRFVVLLVPLLLCSPLRSRLLADVEPGDRIDRTNWQKVEALLPLPVLNWVRRGDYELSIGKLDYEIAWEPEYVAASEANRGKFSLDAEGGIVDPQTGRRPDYIYGFPFPHVDPADPRAGEKILWNKWHALFKGTQNNFPFKIFWVGRSANVEALAN